jgi:uncharacterized cupin superfamily protein
MQGAVNNGSDHMSKVILFQQQTTQAETDYPKQERRVQGNPLRTTWNHFTNDSGEVYSGVWGSEVGSWNIVFGDTEDEFFYVTEGRCRVIDEAGNASEAGPGDALVIPAGFKGVFEVLEPMKKHYVIVERKK